MIAVSNDGQVRQDSVPRLNFFKSQSTVKILFYSILIEMISGECNLKQAVNN